MSFLKKIKEFLEIKEVTVGKPPAKTEEKPVQTEVSPKEGELPSHEEPAIEKKEPEPVEPPEIGEKGRRDRIQT